MMRKRKIIVNRKFQIKIAASFASVSAVTMAIIIIILSTVLIINNRKLKEISNNQLILSGTQEEIFKTLAALSSSKNLGNIHISKFALQQDNNRTKELLNQNSEKIRYITRKNNGIILMVIISAITQSLIIFYLMVKRTHRISGPVFLLNRYIDDLKKGNKPVIRPLRENDDFQDLFENFRELADMIGEKKRKSVKGEDVES